MLAPAVLLVYSTLMATLGAHLLQQARWTHRSPRLGIWAWQMLTASTVLSALLTGLSLALPTAAQATDVASFLDACLSAIRALYLTPGGGVAASVGGMMTLLAVLRLAQVSVLQGYLTARRRRWQRRMLALLGEPASRRDIVILRHQAPAAYCLPGRGGMIVFTTAALARLTAAQAAAVLGHEKAHLSGHHHLILAAAAAVRAAFPFVPAFALAETELGRLVEMRADDAAVRHSDRRILAAALVALAAGAAPDGAVAAGGATALVRARRLVDSSRPLRALPSTAAVLTGLVAVVAPVVVAAGPAVAAALVQYCPLDFLPYGV